MKILITGGAGFIGSNLCEYFRNKGHEVTCLDNLSTGFEHNIKDLLDKENFHFIKGDICDLNTCKDAVKGMDVVLHEAALGSVPRSIEDPVKTNRNNIDGFLNMLVASRDEGIKRFIYAASSSTYGDNKELPKIEHNIGRPLSPYAITKFVNELYANVFADLYGLETIGLRYFNVFGQRQDPNGAYAAVIPLWVKELINHRSPVINGNGTYSRDFTYIDNVIQANELAVTLSKENIIKRASLYNMNLPGNAPLDLVFNVAYGGNTTLLNLFKCLRENLSRYDSEISTIEPKFRENRKGDIPHSLASIEKAKRILGYLPQYSATEGFEQACKWYWKNLQ
ncbi:SDR family oxidoreductase [uncultured Bacteroides sp.]|uniref:SDR family oxidoreductase n=1 Tax=uncultured Bacteroides sp. TaxID=162156 RepID=UPI002AA6BE3D|nr:SDR family oxidoreductase [uncultured Bacteroides sp.]